MSSTDEDERWLMFGVLDHLQKASDRESDSANKESLQEAIFAISNTYKLNMHSSSVKARYPLDGLPLPSVFKAGRAALLSATSSPTGAEGPSSSAPSVSKGSSSASRPFSSGDSAFDSFVERLRTTTAFFDGVEEGSDEYNQRINHARLKYEQRLAAKKQRIDRSGPAPPANSTPPVATAPPTINVNINVGDAASTTKTIDPESKARAVQVKERGNAQLKAKQYEAALQSYTEAISLDPQNAVYYSNRAAANLLLSRFSHAVDDCKKSISLDANFVRPRERLASAYRYLGMTRQEIDALRGVIGLDNSNEAFKAQLRDAEARLARENGSDNAGGGSSGAAGIDPSMINLMANSVGMPPGLVESFANSGMMNQVGNFVRDNPAMVERIMQMMGPGNPSAGGQGQSNGGGPQHPL